MNKISPVAKNKAMLIAIVALIFVGTLITFPIPFELRFCYDVLRNSGTASCFFVKKKLFVSKISLEESGILLKINHKKQIKKYIIDEKKLIFVNHLTKNLFKTLAIRNFYLATRFGVCDVFYSPIICTGVESIINSQLIRLKNSKPHSEISYASSQTALDFSCAINMSARCFISAYDVIKSIIKAKITQKKELSYGK